MIPEKMLKLLILKDILLNIDKDNDYKEYLSKYYDVESLEEDYYKLGLEFLEKYKLYALNTTEKSD